MLSNGVKIPKLGLGTWMIDDDKAVDDVARRDGVVLDLDDVAAERLDGALRRGDLVLGVDALHGDELSADLDERQAQLG